jgi:hypothetical protein
MEDTPMEDQNEWHPDHGAAADQQDRANSQTPNEQPSASEPQDDEQPEDDVPELVIEVIERAGGIFIPPGVEASPNSPYDRMLKGRCVACDAHLKSNTIAFVTKHGVTMLFCSGVCCSDYAVIGFLAQTYEDITQQISFRGNNG